MKKTATPKHHMKLLNWIAVGVIVVVAVAVLAYQRMAQSASIDMVASFLGTSGQSIGTITRPTSTLGTAGGSAGTSTAGRTISGGARSAIDAGVSSNFTLQHDTTGGSTTPVTNTNTSGNTAGRTTTQGGGRCMGDNCGGTVLWSGDAIAASNGTLVDDTGKVVHVIGQNDSGKSTNSGASTDATGIPAIGFVQGGTCAGGANGVTIPAGKWVSTGKKYGTSGRECTFCTGNSDRPYSGSVACDAAYKADPASVILPPDPATEYTQGTPTVNKESDTVKCTDSSGCFDSTAKANCYSGSVIHTTGDQTTDASGNTQFCSNGAWVAPDKYCATKSGYTWTGSQCVNNSQQANTQSGAGQSLEQAHPGIADLLNKTAGTPSTSGLAGGVTGSAHSNVQPSTQNFATSGDCQASIEAGNQQANATRNLGCRLNNSGKWEQYAPTQFENEKAGRTLTATQLQTTGTGVGSNNVSQAAGTAVSDAGTVTGSIAGGVASLACGPFTALCAPIAMGVGGALGHNAASGLAAQAADPNNLAPAAMTMAGASTGGGVGCVVGGAIGGVASLGLGALGALPGCGIGTAVGTAVGGYVGNRIGTANRDTLTPAIVNGANLVSRTTVGCTTGLIAGSIFTPIGAAVGCVGGAVIGAAAPYVGNIINNLTAPSSTAGVKGGADVNAKSPEQTACDLKGSKFIYDPATGACNPTQ